MTLHLSNASPVLVTGPDWRFDHVHTLSSPNETTSRTLASSPWTPMLAAVRDGVPIRERDQQPLPIGPLDRADSIRRPTRRDTPDAQLAVA